MNYTSTSYKIFKLFNYFLMTFIFVVMVFPYLHVAAKAFNDGKDTMMGGITIIPREFTYNNFTALFGDPSIWNAARLSVVIVLLATAFSVFVQFSAAYAMTRRNLPGRTMILIMLTIPMFINGGLIPTYILYSRVGLLDNFWVYILPGAFSFYNMIIIRTYITSTISPSLEESAKIDGANDIMVFFRIITPLCKPIIATILLWVAVGKWNDWTTTLYFIQNTKLFSLQYKLMQVVRESESILKMIEAAIQSGQSGAEIEKLLSVTPESIIAAQILVTTIPIIIVYPFLQKYFVQGVMIGAVKE